jgi:hypothetical protein
VPYAAVAEMHARRYLLRRTATEIFARSGRSLFLAFSTPALRRQVTEALLRRCPQLQSQTNQVSEAQLQSSARNAASISGASSGGAGDDASAPRGRSFRGYAYGEKGRALGAALKSAQRAWQRGDLSNLEYLLRLNALAGRSFNDLTQYPVMPWVLADYASPRLDLDDPATFRDLGRPMGAQSPARREAFCARYEALAGAPDPASRPRDDGTPPAFHYGTHYSSAAIVLHYLVRLEPFASLHCRLQNGYFDHPERLFDSLEGAWRSAAGTTAGGGAENMQDVKELTPEFFLLPDFLRNVNAFDLGVKQDAQRVGDVRLPPWAGGSAHEFVRRHRAALESEHVSARLHEWIDLVFGAKQRGAAAVEAVNVFYHLTYEGAVDLEKVRDPKLRHRFVSPELVFFLDCLVCARRACCCRVVGVPRCRRFCCLGAVVFVVVVQGSRARVPFFVVCLLSFVAPSVAALLPLVSLWRRPGGTARDRRPFSSCPQSEGLRGRGMRARSALENPKISRRESKSSSACTRPPTPPPPLSLSLSLRKAFPSRSSSLGRRPRSSFESRTRRGPWRACRAPSACGPSPSPRPEQAPKTRGARDGCGGSGPRRGSCPCGPGGSRPRRWTTLRAGPRRRPARGVPRSGPAPPWARCGRSARGGTGAG